MTGQIAIIGLGQIGASVGMALKEAGSPLRRVGFDKDIGVLKASESLSVIDHAARRLQDAVRDADIVFLALPLGQMHDVLNQIAGYIKEGSVVMETAPVKSSILHWMRERLPAGRYYVGLVPAITVEAIAAPEMGLKAARPDLFSRTVMMIDIPINATEAVEQLAINFVGLLHAKPMLADLAESDGLMTAAHVLPQLVAAALLHSTVDQPGWGDARKLAGKPFAGVTGGLAYYDDPSSLRAAALANPEAVIHALDVLLASLRGLRDAIESGDEAAVNERLQLAFQARERWLNERGEAEWILEGGEQAEVPHVGDQMMQTFLGGSLLARNKGKKADGKK